MEKKVIYYQDKKGKNPVKEFINNLNEKTRAKVLGTAKFLGEHWGDIGRPIVAYLGDNLYEMRVQFSSDRVRILYAYMFKDYIVLLHGIFKNKAKIPETDKLRAKKRMIDFQIRYKEGRIKLK